jgi:hypothetical protein
MRNDSGIGGVTVPGQLAMTVTRVCCGDDNEDRKMLEDS